MVYYHLIFATKYRRKILYPAALDRAREISKELLSMKGAILEEMNGESDHIHFLIEAPPTLYLPEIVCILKTQLSKQLRRDGLVRGRIWSPSYFVATGGGAPIEHIRKYIQDQ